MSKHLVEINFNEFKFNLYELLGVPSDASEKKIKKAYRKLMLKIHPDKNNYEDEEIFNHLTSANQILTNPSLREKYDNWLKSYGEDNSSHMELKENYKNSIDEISFKMPNKRDATISYHKKVENLNEKHGMKDFNDRNTMEMYNKKLEEFNSKINIPTQNIKNEKDFNNKFQNMIENPENDQIIHVKPNNSIIEFNGELVGNEYLSIKDYSLLYSQDSVQTSNYSSLDRAFMLQPKIQFDESNSKEKMKEYNKFTDELSQLFPKKND